MLMHTVKQARTGVIALAAFTLITGVAYPLLMTVIGQALFPVQTNGSLIIVDDEVRGSALVGQSNAGDSYFWSRPSAVGYMEGSSPDALIASGAGNQGWTSATLAQQVAERAAALRAAHNLDTDTALPPDLLFASGSGLDPHISPEAAALQVERVAAARGLDVAQVRDLVAQYTEAPQLGVLGQPRVNVVLLNLALDRVE